MLNPCHECGHALWSEMRHVGAFRFVVFFDDERSGTYAEPARNCPGCGAGLASYARDLYEFASQPRLRVTVSRTPHPC
jgi:hypothetical protein